MEHHKFKDQLEAFLDGELSSSQEALISQHLTKCTECRETVLEWTQLRATFFSPNKVKAGPDFAVRVMDNIEARRPFDFRAALRWLIPNFSLMLVTLVLVSAVPMQSDQTQLFEPLTVKGAGPFVAHEFTVLQNEAERDWMGLEAL